MAKRYIALLSAFLLMPLHGLAVNRPICEQSILRALVSKAYGDVAVQTECDYDLTMTVAQQKLPGGYLIAYQTPDGSTSPQADVALLETDEQYEQAQPIYGTAYYDGEGTYETISGFSKTVHKFKMTRNRRAWLKAIHARDLRAPSNSIR